MITSQRKLAILLLLAAALLSFSTAVEAQTKVVRFGDHPFVGTPLTSKAEFMTMLEARKADIAEGFVRAEAGDLYGSMMVQKDELELKDYQLQPGTKLHWMMFKSKSTVYVVNDVLYDGKEAVPAYTFTVDNQRKRYTFVVPLICGNISLLKVDDIPNKPPICSLNVMPANVEVGNTFSADASGSYDPDGTIAKVEFKMVDMTGKQIDGKTVSSEPFVCTMKVPAEGEYTVSAVVTDNEGATSPGDCEIVIKGYVPKVDQPRVNQSPSCNVNVLPKVVFPGEPITADASASVDPDGSIAEITFVLMNADGEEIERDTVTAPPFKSDIVVPSSGDYQLKAIVKDNEGKAVECGVMGIKGMSRLGVVADLGIARQFDPAWYAMGRIGMQYKFTRNVALLGLVGGFLHIDGTEGESAFVIDGILNFSNSSGFFVGVGAGAWFSDGDDDIEHEDSQIDLILNFGMRIFGDPMGTSTSIFFEGRSAYDEFDELEAYGRWIIGLRFLF
jgi:hypothetical protein